MFRFIREIFFGKKKKKEDPVKVEKERRNITSADFIDYDGMGNQGRFPSVRKKNDRKR